MSSRKIQRPFKFTYQTEYSPEHDYYKTLYATTTRLAWLKFKSYCEDHNIRLHDASVTLKG